MRYLGAVLMIFLGCGGSSNKECKLDDPTTCSGGQVCEAYTLSGATHNACFAPTLLKGKITSIANNAAIAGARVVAIDGDSHAAAGAVSVSDMSGDYSVRVVAPRTAGAQKQ